MKLSESEFEQLSSLIERALDVPEAEREAWIGREAKGDADLERMLRLALLATTDPFISLSDERRTRAFSAARKTMETIEELRADEAGDRVGPYRLLRPIGAGGMGTVWLAERADGTLQRQVALKLPRVGLAPDRVREMKREQEILAALEHPNIARLYDAGITEEGRPYLAMEYVDGVPIDAHVREHALPVRERLALFLDVARALAFAHQRLIVHRDLKPQNILAGKDGRVHLLDFGIAKLIEDEPSPGTVTAPSHRALTPAYAAPEQLSGGRITMATDVYLLGVVLFELLAGERPYTIEEVSSTARDLTETVAPIPFVSSRAKDPRIARSLRGDLDTIVAKAMKRDPAERYSSAEAMAEDVERHLAGRPVRARPDSRVYRVRLFVRRNRTAVSAAVLVALAIIAGGAISAWQAHAATLAAQRSERVKNFIASIFTEARPREGVGGAISAGDLLLSAESRLETELNGEPRVAAELGVLIGESFSALGEPERGGPALKAAVARATEALGPRDPLTLHARALWVESHTVGNDMAGAQQLLTELVPDLLAILPANAVDCVRALRSLSFVQAELDQKDESIATLKKAIEISERHLGANNDDTITSIGLLANTYGSIAQREPQLEHATEALKRATEAHGKNRPSNLLTQCERWYAEALTANFRLAEAVEILRNVMKDQRTIDGVDTNRTMNAELRLAQALSSSGALEESLPLMRHVVAVDARLRPGRRDAAIVSALAQMLMSARSSTESLALYDSIEAMTANSPLPKLMQIRNLISRGRATAASGGDGDRLGEEAIERSREEKIAAFETEGILVRATNARMHGRFREAKAFAEESSARASDKSQPDALRARAGMELGLAELELGEREEAEKNLQRSWDTYLRLHVEPSVISSDQGLGLARVWLATGKTKEAAALLQPVEASWSAVNPESPFHGEVLHYLAQATGDAAMRARAKALLAKSPIPTHRALAAAK